MKSLRSLLLLTFIWSSWMLTAQEFQVPASFNPDSTTDFKQYEPQIVRAVDWLLTHPPKGEKYKEVGRFVFQWLDKTPTITLVLDPDIVTFTDCPRCLLIYMAVYAKDAIQHPDAGIADHNVAALNALVDYYVKYKKFLPSDKAMKKYVKMAKKGKLEAYIRKHSS